MRHVRRSEFILSAALVTLAVAWIVFPARDQLLYNHTPSVPVGLYLRSNGAIERGAFVTVRAVDVAPDQAALRNYDGPRNRFIKRVSASAGDEVCAEGDTLIINGQPRARRLSADRTGRTLPWWNECRVLSSEEILLLGDTEDSFDGRYWGPIDRSLVEGVWRRL